MTDLFDSIPDTKPKPLAAMLRPDSLDDILGQDSITGPNSLLRRKIAAGKIGSLVLYGPTGTGKTTIARIAGKMMQKAFHEMHAAHDSVADIKAVIQRAKQEKLLVFIDEVHAFNKTAQQYLLRSTENGEFDLISATTRNPYHDIDAALISRSTVLQLQPIALEKMIEITRDAISKLAETGTKLHLGEDQIKMIAGRASGDARRAISVIEDLSLGRPAGQIYHVTDADIAEIYKAAPIQFDRDGDQHYDVISAFIKSMRGSDPDATLYWLARLIHAGEDPRYIARRIMIHASEDIGLADNSALQTAVAAHTAVSTIGYPEAEIVLAHAALHIARAPKSNAAFQGIKTAMNYVQTSPAIPVPLYLRDQHYAGAKKLGYDGYLFPHATELGWVAQDYAPGIRNGQFYQSHGRPDISEYTGRQTFEEEADIRNGIIKMMAKRESSEEES